LTLKGQRQMTVILRQVLPPDAGLNLPAPIRQALVDHGIACNLAARAVNQAADLDQQAITERDHIEALVRGDQLARAVEDVAVAADRFHTLTLVGLARAATAYAVYSSQIAVQVAADQPVTDAGDSALRLKPSDVITAAGMYLPPLSFSSRGQSETQQVADLNANVQRSYLALNSVITNNLQGCDVTLYDDLTAATRIDARATVPDVFPIALYDYAATVAEAVGMLTGVDESA
jgi:hypothetical protein